MSEGAGRPKNVNEKMLADALDPILRAIDILTEKVEAKAPGTNGVLSRAEFLGRMQVAMAAQKGEIAFSERFVRSMSNQADSMYEGYLKVVHGGGPTNKEKLDAAQAELEAIRVKLAQANQREVALKAAFDESQAHKQATS